MYLIPIATHGARLPLGPAESNQLLSKRIVGLGGQSVVDAGQLRAEQALLAALSSHRAAASLVQRRVRLCRRLAQPGKQEAAGGEGPQKSSHGGAGCCEMRRSAARTSGSIQSVVEGVLSAARRRRLRLPGREARALRKRAVPDGVCVCMFVSVCGGCESCVGVCGFATEDAKQAEQPSADSAGSRPSCHASLPRFPGEDPCRYLMMPSRDDQSRHSAAATGRGRLAGWLVGCLPAQQGAWCVVFSLHGPNKV